MWAAFLGDLDANDSRYTLNMLKKSSLDQNNQEKLFKAIHKTLLEDLGIEDTFSYSNMRSQFSQKDRKGRGNDPEWTDPDWDRVKANNGDATETAKRDALDAIIVAAAQSEGLPWP